MCSIFFSVTFLILKNLPHLYRVWLCIDRGGRPNKRIHFCRRIPQTRLVSTYAITLYTLMTCQKHSTNRTRNTVSKIADNTHTHTHTIGLNYYCRLRFAYIIFKEHCWWIHSSEFNKHHSIFNKTYIIFSHYSSKSTFWRIINSFVSLQLL